ncbi:FHA domain-containing protein [Trichlorobacter thiogenes]|uniref:FHA domain-containing protein n=1 Tax=Trichlorobacter thiogenes TaxID=115783 RepID=A0A1T4QDW7_9BACT|nr:FHA domain-containing protein [Trichlorobacter thiogenes]SKA01721.1 FHA domain-containing protein [Trichlorobacter thiogenes]
MTALTLPIGTIQAAATTYSREIMVELLKGLSGSSFTGYLGISNGDRLFLLFIFQGTPYSAGLAVGEKPTPLTITNFCAQVATIRDGSGTISLHETDPVLLKCMLVFIQDEPAAKGPVNLINLDGMVSQIKANEADALVILEKDGCCNFFFFLDGTKTAAYWSDGLSEDPNGLSVDEQMLLYAYQETATPVSATIYQTLNTMKSKDSSNISLEGIVRLFAAVEDTEQTIAPGKLTIQHHDQLRLKVLEGTQAGSELGGSLPCVLGRKDADIVINDPMVSKRHAAIQIINGKLLLVDLHSTNGTTLNNEPVTQRELKQGDRIGIGQTVLLIKAVTP